MALNKNNIHEFTRFYEEHKNAVFNYLLYRVSFDRDLAEDLTSEVFLKAFEHFDSFDRARSFKTWIFTIAHNHLINYLTGRKQTISLDESLKVSDGDLVDEKNPFGDSIDHKVLTEKIVRLIEALPEPQRELVTLRYVNDLSNNEIAKIVSKDEGAVRTALSRAIATLRNTYMHRFIAHQNHE